MICQLCFEEEAIKNEFMCQACLDANKDIDCDEDLEELIKKIK